ncbi:MAG: hypothetical protein EOO75_18585, partial [Myxococcales bacterium]
MRTKLLITLTGALLGACAASSPSPAPPERSPGAPSSTSAMASVAPPSSAADAVAPADPTCGPGQHPDQGKCVADAAAPVAPCGSGMALVTGGFYAYGQKKDPTRVDSFCMDVNETTAEGYAACVKAGKCSDKELKCAAQATYGVDELKTHPMVCVDFEQSEAYCTFAGKRLPTDEEWEWAARGGAKATKFPWGDEAPKDQLCWAGAGPQKGTCAVGSFKTGANPQGILDLAGGVFEFTTTKNDTKSPTRVGRGGSWRDGTADAFRANRVGG